MKIPHTQGHLVDRHSGDRDLRQEYFAHQRLAPGNLAHGYFNSSTHLTPQHPDFPNSKIPQRDMLRSHSANVRPALGDAAHKLQAEGVCAD